MKKFFTLLFASIGLISVKAQSNFDTAIQPGTSASSYKTNSLFTEPAASVSKTPVTAKKRITIMPNAATKDIKIIFKTDKAADATIEVIDDSGKKVLNQAVLVSVGNNNINVDNSHSLNEGTYTIQLTSNNETYTSKFMIWN